MPPSRRVSVFWRRRLAGRVSVFQGRGELRAPSRRTERCEPSASGNHRGARRTARPAHAAGEAIAHRKGQDLTWRRGGKPTAGGEWPGAEEAGPGAGAAP
ncbi:hypothetical protein SBRY_60123 [Actinacidiphila bryophytorum]|uniref:Uncharacterized protein n=1 Tax=Actinacidiphila bryophytorum TaxID=1436133 RepID=A0A9W4H5Y8_9ACTN|nr:hypothetical protein SBRY_60123 [Actinacidiphila bryophytorum]